MLLKDIIHLMKTVQSTDFDSFELKDADFCLKLKRNNKHLELSVGSPDGSALPPLITREVPKPEPAPVILEEINAGGVAEEEVLGDKAIVSPLVGIYHALPDDRSVKEGDVVRKGSPVCLIEAMKLMNEIVMPEDGEITSVELNDGDTVEYEQTLFRYR